MIIPILMSNNLPGRKIRVIIKSAAVFLIVGMIIFSAISAAYAETFSPPQNIGAEALCDPAVNVFWKAPNGQVQSYNIENVGVWAPKNTTDTGYTDNAVSNGKYYIYDVTAVYSQGESEPSSIFIKTPTEDECKDIEGTSKSQKCPYSSDAVNNKYALEFNKVVWKAKPIGPTIPVSMPAGRYKVSLVSFDGYPKRVKTYQPNEQWYVSLKNSSGAEIAKTSANTDLRDYVIYDYKNEVVDESLTINGCAASAQSLWGGGWDKAAGSVNGVCAYFEKLDAGNSCQLNQNNNPVSITSFTATPNTVNSGSSSNLQWATVNAVSCMASNGWSGIKTVSGSQSTGNLTETTTYTLQCIDFDGGSDTKSVTVNVIPLNTITSVNCQASPQTVNIGQDVTWTVNPNPPSGSYTYSWSGDENLSGSSQSVVKSYPTVGTKNASVDIDGASNPQQCTATVKVMANPYFDEF